MTERWYRQDWFMIVRISALFVLLFWFGFTAAMWTGGHSTLVCVLQIELRFLVDLMHRIY